MNFWRRIRSLECSNVPEERLGSLFDHGWVNLAMGRMLVTFAGDQDKWQTVLGEHIWR